MTDTVRLWISEFNKGDVTVEQEIENIKNAIKYSEGSTLENLKEYLYWLENVAS